MKNVYKDRECQKPPFFVVFEHRLYRTILKTLHQTFFSILPNPVFRLFPKATF